MGEETKSLEDLIRQLGADDPEERERAARELRRRVLIDHGLLQRLQRELDYYSEANTSHYDAEIAARLHWIIDLAFCRYFLRVEELEIRSSDGTPWNASNVQIQFGDSSNSIRVTTPDQDLGTNAPTVFDPQQHPGLPVLPVEQLGLQILNSWDDDHEDHECGEEVVRVLFIKVGHYGESSETIRFRCRTGHASRVVTVPGHFGFRRQALEFKFKINVICKCGWPF